MIQFRNDSAQEKIPSIAIPLLASDHRGSRTHCSPWGTGSWAELNGVSGTVSREHEPLETYLHGVFSQFGPLKLNNINTRYKADAKVRPQGTPNQHTSLGVLHEVVC